MPNPVPHIVLAQIRGKFLFQLPLRIDAVGLESQQSEIIVRSPCRSREDGQKKRRKKSVSRRENTLFQYLKK